MIATTIWNARGPLPKGGEAMMASGSARWGALTHKSVGLCDRREENPLQPPAPFERGERKCSPHQFTLRRVGFVALFRSGESEHAVTHACTARRNSSRGGVEGHATSAVSPNLCKTHCGSMVEQSESAAGADDLRKLAPSASDRREVSRATKGRAGLKPGPRETFPAAVSSLWHDPECGEPGRPEARNTKLPAASFIAGASR